MKYVFHINKKQFFSLYTLYTLYTLCVINKKILFYIIHFNKKISKENII